MKLLTERRLAFAHQILRFVPGSQAAAWRARLDRFRTGLDLLMGIPNETALNLAYWKCAGSPPKGDRNPTRDGVGLIWYDPLVPVQPEICRRYVDMVREVCPRHGLDPILTFTTVSDGCFVSTVPLLFDRQDAGQTENAQACYEELFAKGVEIGCHPYRMGVGQQHLLTPSDAACWKFGTTLKSALDPDGILAPGRYQVNPEQ